MQNSQKCLRGVILITSNALHWRCESCNKWPIFNTTFMIIYFAVLIKLVFKHAKWFQCKILPIIFQYLKKYNRECFYPKAKRLLAVSCKIKKRTSLLCYHQIIGEKHSWYFCHGFICCTRGSGFESRVRHGCRAVRPWLHQ